MRQRTLNSREALGDVFPHHGATHRAEALGLADRLRVDAACDRFEQAWRAGERPAIGVFLTEFGDDGPARAALLRELEGLEREFRRAAGAAESEGGNVLELSAVSDDSFTIRPAQPCAVLDPPALAALHAAGYAVDAELGRGGMGVVFRATQLALGRPVALKVVRSGLFITEAERRRFQNEAEAVASLDHPHIVPIYEVGERAGQPFFSMKLIAGTSLDTRLDAFAAEPRAAARVVATTAGAVHHAHQRGVLHRDLKPANILLDERGEPHVTDFGLARRINADCGLTHSDTLIGTPSYMSPEQARGARGELTTATDVYGLGTVLYALLAGRAPFAGSSFGETLDLVRQAPPEAPSRVRPGVPRDLEVICLKCLEKDPARRYASAQELADDLGRWLCGEPIAARPVGRAARVGMWCRRNPLPAALAALLATSLAVGAAGVAREWVKRERSYAANAAVNDFLTRQVLAAASTERNPYAAGVTMLDVLDRAALVAGGAFQGQPEVEAAVRETLGRSYVSLGRHAQAVPHLRRALRLDTELLGPTHRTTLRAEAALAGALGPGEAEPLLRRNLAACRRALGPTDEATLDAAGRLGALLHRLGRLGEAEPLLRECLNGRRAVLRPGHADTLHATYLLSLLLRDRGRYAEAENLAHDYAQGVRCAWGPKHPENVSALTNQGLILLDQGRRGEVEPFFRQAVDEARRILGPDHPETRAAEERLGRLRASALRNR